jgi:Subtilase family
MQVEQKLKHFFLSGTSKSFEFTAKSAGGGGDEKPPSLPRQSHAMALSSQLEGLKNLAATVTTEQQNLGLEGGLGLQIQFTSQPDIELAFQSLANETKGIELLSVRMEGAITYANVFVPEGRLAHFENYIAEYLSEKKDKNGNTRDHSALFNTIAEIRSAAVRSLWTDDISLLPNDPTAEFWWEVWLRVGENRNLLVADFRKLATLSGCLVREQQANFPERTVLLMRASEHQFARSVHTLNCVAELRRAKETAEFFDGMAVSEQRQWSDEMVRRLEVAPEENVPFVCVLDSGVNRGHPLLTPLLDSADLHCVEHAWGTDDISNHGTGLAGLIAYGDLTEALSSTLPWQVGHRMESVKLIPNESGNQGTAELHAALFAEGVARPEIQAPLRQRVFTSAVTASDYRDRGQPSSWSSWWIASALTVTTKARILACLFCRLGTSVNQRLGRLIQTASHRT